MGPDISPVCYLLCIDAVLDKGCQVRSAVMNITVCLTLSPSCHHFHHVDVSFLIIIVIVVVMTIVASEACTLQVNL